MDVTTKLLRVFLVEKQIRGLTSRLNVAERFLAEQARQLKELDDKKETLDRQARALQAKVADGEGEMKRLDARTEALRSQMNNAQTNREYKAFLTEVNTLKADRDKVETITLEHMQRLEEVRKDLDKIAATRAERQTLVGVATEDRRKREEEIKDRLAELQSERAKVTAEAPKDSLAVLERLLETKGEDAMAPLEEQDRKRLEFNCGVCMMSQPVELINGLLSGGRLTRCVSCGTILYLEKELSEAMAASSKR